MTGAAKQHDAAVFPDHEQQSSSVHLDSWTALVLCSKQKSLLQQVLKCIIKACNDGEDGASEVARRWVQSVVRLYTIVASAPLKQPSSASPIMTSLGHHQEGRNSAGAPTYDDKAATLLRCRLVFNAMPAYAVQALAESAEAVMAPVRLGLVVPEAMQASALHPGGEPEETVESRNPRGRWRRPSWQVRADELSGHHRPASAVGRRVHGHSRAFAFGYDPDGDSQRGRLGGSGNFPWPFLSPPHSVSRTATARRDVAATDAPSVATTAAAAAAAAAPPPSRAGANEDAAMEDEMMNSLSWAVRDSELRERLEDDSAHTTIGANSRRARLHGRHRQRRVNARDAGGAYTMSSGGDGDGEKTSASPSTEPTATHLSRLFGRLVRELVAVAAQAVNPGSRDALVGQILDDGHLLLRAALLTAEARLQQTWSWACHGMDVLEGQLRLGRQLREQRPPLGESSAPAASQPPRYGSPRPELHRQGGPGGARDPRFLPMMDSRLLDHGLAGRSLRPSEERRFPPPPWAPMLSQTQAYDAGERARSRESRAREAGNREGAEGPDMAHVLWRLNRASPADNYVLSLLRAHAREHRDSLPQVDIGAYRHVAYALDAMIVYIRKQQSLANQLGRQGMAPLARAFFLRSDSIVPGGGVAPAMLSLPLHEALPLASRPDRLHPGARRSSLFGVRAGAAAAGERSMAATIEEEASTDEDDARAAEPPAKREKRTAATAAGRGARPSSPLDTALDRLSDFDVSTAEVRWRLAMSVFARIFLDDVGAERDSFLPEIAGFRVKEKLFRRGMAQAQRTATGSLAFQAHRNPVQLLEDFYLNLAQHAQRQAGQQQPMAVRHVNVSFKGEMGEGIGVTRAFFNTVADLLRKCEALPPLSATMRKKLQLLCMADGSPVADGAKRPRAATPADAMAAMLPPPSADLRAATLQAFHSSPEVTRRRSFTRTGFNPPREPLDTLAEVAGAVEALPAEALEAVLKDSEACKKPWPERREALAPRLQNALAAHLATLEVPPRMERRTFHKLLGDVLALHAEELRRDVAQRGRDAVLAKVTRMARAVSGVLRPSFAEGKNGWAMALALKSASDAERASGGPPSPAVHKALWEAAGRDDLTPLFFQPGQMGFFSPRPGPTALVSLCLRAARGVDAADGEAEQEPSFVGMCALSDDPFRLLLYRCVGRFVGLCLLSHCVLPLHFSRHVLKFLLGRDLGFHDLAFFDPAQYEALRQVLTSREGVEAMALTFRVSLPAAMGGAEVDLVPDGDCVAVTPANVHRYVELYSQMLMVGPSAPALVAMRDGLREVLRPSLLADLTAEDFRLLLNGTTAVDLALLRRVTIFKKEVDSAEQFNRLKEWFWDIVARMTSEQQHDLCYFWTSSPSLPATKEGFSAQPLVVVRPPSDALLPTANTCSARLNIPLYSSKEILEQKLLMAIQTKGFGFV